MLKKMSIRNLTAFSRADLEFSRQLNVIVGENATGKTHLLKLAYVFLSVSAEEARKSARGLTGESALGTRVADKLLNVFRPERLAHLVHHDQPVADNPQRPKSNLKLEFDDARLDMSFGLGLTDAFEVKIEKVPSEWSTDTPVYFPTRELLTLYPNFVSFYEGHYLEFEESWRDTCVLLGEPLKRGQSEARIRELLEPLERAMEGSLELDKNGHFYLKVGGNRFEVPLVAEGFRKLGMLARLIANGVLLDKGYLFWDEPDANLNPRLVKRVADCILALSLSGVQIFLATHSLFLLRELEILLSTRYGALDSRFFGLHRTSTGVQVKQGPVISDIGDIAALDEQLEQSDRFLEEGSRRDNSLR